MNALSWQLCAGLKHMHSFDPPYAHNDIKPGNILVTHQKGRSPLAILMDFGSAKPAKREIRSRSEALQLQVVKDFLESYAINGINFSFSVPYDVTFSFILEKTVEKLRIQSPWRHHGFLKAYAWKHDTERS